MMNEDDEVATAIDEWFAELEMKRIKDEPDYNPFIPADVLFVLELEVKEFLSKYCFERTSFL